MTIDEVFSAFPQLETPRLILRRIMPADAEALFSTFSDEDVVRYLDETRHHTIEDSAALIRQQFQWYSQKQGIRWGITRKGEDTVIGSCGFHRFDEHFGRAETGYELNRAHWRQGIMTEAMRAIIKFGFEELHFNRIEAVVNHDNERSKVFLTSLGFVYEGCLRQSYWFNGRYVDEHIFGMLREDYDRLSSN